MVAIAWTSPENPRFALHASVGEGGKRIANLGHTAQGIMLCLNPSGASGNPVADMRRSRIGGEQTGPGITSIC